MPEQLPLASNVTFAAILTDAERRMLADLPDWPTEQKVADAQRPHVARLKRLGCIQVKYCKDDPDQIFFDLYAGVTPLGRASVAGGTVRL